MRDTLTRPAKGLRPSLHPIFSSPPDEPYRPSDGGGRVLSSHFSGQLDSLRPPGVDRSDDALDHSGGDDAGGGRDVGVAAVPNGIEQEGEPVDRWRRQRLDGPVASRPAERDGTAVVVEEN